MVTKVQYVCTFENWILMHTHKPNSTGRSKRLRPIPNLKIAGERKGEKILNQEYVTISLG